MMNTNNITIKKLINKNITVLKQESLVYGIMLMNLLIILSNGILTKDAFSVGNNKIGYIDLDVCTSVIYQVAPVLLFVLSWRMYREEFGKGYIKTDLILGYTRNEILGVKIALGAVLSMLLFWLPYGLVYLILFVIHLCGVIEVTAFSSIALYTAVRACFSHGLYCVWFNSTFATICLAFKLPFVRRWGILIYEIIMFIAVQVFFTSLTMKSDRIILFIGLNILGFIIAARTFRGADL